MKDHLTPKQVARAIGVSESSLKRWCNEGLLPTIRTPGGHRRLPVSGVLSFLRDNHHTVVDPAALGLPASSGQSERIRERAVKLLCDSLIEGDEQRTRKVLFDLYLANHALAEIGDEVIVPVFERIGEMWDCGKAEVYQERRSCEHVLRAINELRLGISNGNPEQFAVGATLEGDNYALPTTLVELVLRENNWQACSLGSGVPADSLVQSIHHLQPQLFWLSVSYIADEDRFLSDVPKLYEACQQRGTSLVVGGRALTTELRQQLTYSAHCDTFRQLVAFQQSWKTATSKS